MWYCASSVCHWLWVSHMRTLNVHLVLSTFKQCGFCNRTSHTHTRSIDSNWFFYSSFTLNAIINCIHSVLTFIVTMTMIFMMGKHLPHLSQKQHHSIDDTVLLLLSLSLWLWQLLTVLCSKYNHPLHWILLLSKTWNWFNMLEHHNHHHLQQQQQ